MALVSLDVWGIEGMGEVCFDFQKTPLKSAEKTLRILHKIASSEKEIHALFRTCSETSCHEDKKEDCACCDESQSEFMTVKIKVSLSNELYDYYLNLFLPNEMVFEEILMRGTETLFRKAGNEVFYPAFPEKEALFERNDSLHLPVSPEAEIINFRENLTKDLAKGLKIA
ncbi:hypothetical protein FAI40_03835 [Acetobacteraceae bacterium]|nr:hypothetical protein FAI40_03835 [Acetobacteraceae bacterium]